MQEKCYLGNDVYITMYQLKKNRKKYGNNRYKVVVEFYDEYTGQINKREIYYCCTYIDAYYLYRDLIKVKLTI